MKIIKKLILILLLCSLLISTLGCGDRNKGADMSVDSLLESKHTLRFDKNGEFKILVLSDLHLRASDMPEYIDNCIKTLVDREDPDLIILTGDNVADTSIDSDEIFRQTLNYAVDYIEEKKISWMHVYGNHDSEGSYTREQQQRVYESFEYCLSKFGPDITGVGNYVLPIYSSTDDSLKFAIWGLDSGSYMSEEDRATLCPEESAFGGYDGRGYDYIHLDQIEWYLNASRLIQEYNGGYIVPGLMAFHIPLQETYTAWINRNELGFTGEKREAVCASAHNSGLFNAVFSRGDIKAIVYGHDHINDYAIEYGGIKLCYSPSFSTNTYNNEDMHGARVFVISEGNPSAVETYVSYIHRSGNK